MSLASILINASYVALLGSAFARGLLWLRALLVLGSALFVVYGILEGIASIIVWNVVIGGFHGLRIVRDLRARRGVQLHPDEAAIRDEWFADLDDFDFSLLWSLGRSTVFRDEAVIAEGDRPEDVSFILDGEATITSGTAEIARLGRGQLIGEMSLVTGQDAGATVSANGELVVHRWDQRDIVTLNHVSPAGARAFQALVAKDLANKAR